MDDQTAAIAKIPISKIIFIGVVILVLLYIFWKCCSPSTVAVDSKQQSKEEEDKKKKKDEEAEVKAAARPTNEYESFMDRLQKGEVEARRRALALADDQKKAREAEEAAQRARDMERVKTHTQPIGTPL